MTTFNVHFENAKGHSLAKDFEARSWEDAVEAFRDWCVTQGGMSKFKLIGVKGITC